MNKIVAAVLAGVMAVSGFNGKAYAMPVDTIDEYWGKPVIVYGGGLSDVDLENTYNLFNVGNRDNVNEMRVYGQDLDRYLNFVGGDTSSLISSVMVKKTSSNGVQVNILTPQNITKITQQQYANAAITAGVYNCEIEVASITRVTGESALTGVYKAFEANGETLDLERTAVAQEELETTNQIALENEGNGGFDSTTLDAAMAEIKKELAEAKKENGSVDDQTIINIVTNVINNYNLGSILSQENVNRIISLMSKYVDTSAIDSKEVLEQLKKLSKSLHIDVDAIVRDAQESGLWADIVRFFTNLWNSVVNR
ncbi:MAG: DUF1002 domain-containing protein [Firmicutes bacterium]|nr:DUF1002 domain-containing protein [Bacillota bacterium]